MIESVIITLIYICIFALVVWLVIWVLQSVGVPLPAQVIKILWIIFGLLCLLWLAGLFLGGPGMPLRLPR